ncbi:MAG: type II secretion system F family protein [Fimbriimonadaceae bacterium]|nr:type II secretion system F family protein [Chthonomonadaceae bacterium]MCO5295811.1 type II secretion system F family protein [Fimbriimonadaceae bacterium]
MSFFRYSARDAQGKILEGTIEAPDVREASRLLVDRGYRVDHIQPSGAATRVPVDAVPDGPTIRTKRATDKDRFLLFSQLASLLRSGVNPHQACETLARRTRHSGMQRACQDVATSAREGAPISSVLERYPYLFPPHVVGIVRAGEAAGFLPEACERIADQAESSHKFGRAMWMATAVFLHALLIIPGAWLATRGVSTAWDKIDASGGAGGAAGGLRLMLDSMIERLRWPVGPITLGVYVLLWLGWLVWKSMPLRPLRHRMGLQWVAYGPRARQEGLAIFAWALSRISNAGIAPQAAWRMAVDCVPNLELQERIRDAGSRLRENQPMSEAFFESRLFPEEYAPMMATGEQTGDIPGTLSRLAEAGRSEFESATGKAKWRTGCWSSLGCFVASAVVFALFIYMWLYEIPNKVLPGFSD